MEYTSLFIKAMIYMVRYLSSIKKVYKKMRHGDIEKVLNNSYKIIEKENEIKDIIVNDSRDGLDWILFQIRLVGKLEILDREINELMLEFAASTTKVKGDAKNCSIEIKEQFEKIYEYRQNILRHYNNLVDVIKMQIDNKAINITILRTIRSKKIEQIETKIDSCLNKVKNDIKILKELHDG